MGVSAEGKEEPLLPVVDFWRLNLERVLLLRGMGEILLTGHCNFIVRRQGCRQDGKATTIYGWLRVSRSQKAFLLRGWGIPYNIDIDIYCGMESVLRGWKGHHHLWLVVGVTFEEGVIVKKWEHCTYIYVEA